MFCQNCGNKIKEDNKFCTACGNSAISEKIENKKIVISDDKWYLRLARVIYIILYIPLPFVLYDIWTSDAPHSYYSSYSNSYTNYGSYDDAFLSTLLTLIVWVFILRLIKIAALYIIVGRKPYWKKEFNKLF